MQFVEVGKARSLVAHALHVEIKLEPVVRIKLEKKISILNAICAKIAMLIQCEINLNTFSL